MPTWTFLYVALYWGLFLPCIFLASLKYGDRALRYAATSYTCLTVIGQLSLMQSTFHRVEPVAIASDAVLFGLFAILAISTRRWWLYAMSALQLLSALGHAAALAYHPSRLAYALLTNLGAYPILLLFLFPLIPAVRRTLNASRPSPGATIQS